MKSKKIAVLAGAAALAAIVITAGVIFFMGDKEPKGYVLNEDNYEQIMEQMDGEVQAGYFETYMNTEWSFKDGTSKTEDALFGNSPNNSKPIRCEVILTDTEETVYSSGVLPVGAKLPPFSLDKDLDAGVYSAVCQVYLLDEAADGSFVDSSSAGFYITLTVKN